MDFIVDMVRTGVNVIGNSLAAAVVDSSEKRREAKHGLRTESTQPTGRDAAWPERPLSPPPKRTTHSDVSRCRTRRSNSRAPCPAGFPIPTLKSPGQPRHRPPRPEHPGRMGHARPPALPACRPRCT
ncbi:hypothetical protein ACFVEN_00085 [Streptomyces sp. NPDC057681]|uniref:hypothetical protein n=1 Tax=Streptomyces sp. NPDC057681 TaxID=3346209 RepID=UPI00367A959C